MCGVEGLELRAVSSTPTATPARCTLHYQAVLPATRALSIPPALLTSLLVTCSW